MHPSNRSITAFLLTLVLLAGCSSPAPSPTTAPQPTTPPTQPPTSTSPPPTDTPVSTETPTAIPPSATTAPTPTPTELPVFFDDFEGELQPDWSWIRENDAMWSLTSNPGFLRIVLQRGNPHRNLLVRDVGSDNFQIMTHVLFEPTSNFQFAGLLVYQNDDTYVSFGRAYCNIKNQCVGNGVYFDAIETGQYQGNNFGADTQLKDEAYLRLDKNGSILTAYYSEDGSNWMKIGEHEVSLTDPKVGLIASQSNVVGMTANFDNFSVMEMP